MAKFSLVGEPEISSNRLTWSAVLDPGTFELASAGSTTDTVDCWRMTANDPAGRDVRSELVVQFERLLPHDVMPGDTYTNSVDLSLHDGYYHFVLTIDGDDGGSVYELHVRAEDGNLELKSFHLSMA